MSYIDAIFKRGGAFNAELSDYEVRPGQVELARAFDRSIEAERPLMAEGPCGSGKGFAYLVPAIYHSVVNKVGRVLVVTANIALQEQLVRKDLPFLQDVLPWRFTFGLLKGRGNYLCLHKRGEVEEKLVWGSDGKILHGPYKDEEMGQFRQIWPWTLETETGDKSDLEFETSKIWWLLSSGHDDCLGQVCPFGTVCWANLARKAAMGANVLVMNYHLRFIGEGAMTPEHAIMICDEAHETAEIARNFLGWTVSPSAINRIAHWLGKNDDKPLASRMRDLGGRLFLTVAEMMDKQNTLRLYDAEWANVDELVACLEKTNEIAHKEAERVKLQMSDTDTETRDKLKVRMGRAKRIGENALTLAYRLQRTVKLDAKDWVFWQAQDKKRQRYTLEARPIEVANTIAELFYPVASHSVILISATMTSGGSFAYVRGELGVPEEAGEIVAPSPFDLREQGLLFVPSEMSPPPKFGDKQSELAFQNDICFYSEELIKMCGGRSLLLFTSWKNLNYVHRYLTAQSDVCKGLNLLKQGERPRMKLIADFKRDETSVLLGVASFWTGIDVPGRALTGLLIDKIPFGSPADPVNKAIDELLKSRGRNVFMERAIPQATITLRQGAGRLIRTRSDIGIVVITDTRLLTTGYGDGIVSSLPEYKKVRSLERAQAFAEVMMKGA